MIYQYVSIIIPCRNEEKFVARCLDSIIASDYPRGKIEVLIVDGMSDDGTGEILERYSKEYPFIRRLENPLKITPCAFNLGIKHSKGDVIMIMGSHSTYGKDYISKCVRYLNEYDADNVGGKMITLPRDNTFIGKAIVTALSHRFGVGNSAFRTGSKKPVWVDTVFGGCYRRELFDRIGLFNEDLICTQDMEFNRRLKNAGGKILLVPEIVSYYHARSDFRSYIKHNFRNGVWALVPFMYSSTIPVSWRHLIPLVFVLSLIGSAALSFFYPGFLLLFVSICGLYLLANVYFSSKIALAKEDRRYIALMPVIFASLHIAYGLGSIKGLLKVIASKQFWKNLLKTNGIKLKTEALGR